MNIGQNYILIKVLKPTDVDAGNITYIAKTGTERPLCLAETVGDFKYKNLKDKTVVVIDDTFIAYWLDDDVCCIEQKGVLCTFDIKTKDCRSFDTDDMVVVKASTPDDDTFLRNVYVQNGLIIIGGIESGSIFSQPDFDVPVVATTTGDSVHHILTDSGDYFTVTKNDIIIVFVAPETH